MPFDIHSEQKISSYTVFSACMDPCACTFAGSSVHVLKDSTSSFDIYPRLILSINISVGRSIFDLSWWTLGQLSTGC